MKTPMSEKTQEIRDMIEAVFPGTAERIATHHCPMCHLPIDFDQYRDKLSIREYEISGLCQPCQDQIFQIR
jgi:hypothetical protein